MTTDSWTTFRHNLEKLIVEAGSVEALASDAGVSFWTVQSWRSRDVSPTYDSLAKVAKASRMSVDKLVGDRLR